MKAVRDQLVSFHFGSHVNMILESIGNKKMEIPFLCYDRFYILTLLDGSFRRVIMIKNLWVLYHHYVFSSSPIIDNLRIVMSVGENGNFVTPWYRKAKRFTKYVILRDIIFEQPQILFHQYFVFLFSHIFFFCLFTLVYVTHRVMPFKQIMFLLSE